MNIAPTIEDLQRLDPYEVEQTIQRAIRGFLASKNFPQTCAGRPPRRTTKDGGLEITLELPDRVPPPMPFVAHRVVLQVKSTDAHLTKTEIEEELDKPELKEFLQSAGQFFLVYPKYEPATGKHGTVSQKHLTVLKTCVTEILGTDIQVDLWYPDDVREFISKYPSSWELFPRGTHYLSGRASTLEAMEINSPEYFSERGFDIPFVLNGDREVLLNDLIALMRGGSYNYLELRGNMGIGKTRLLFEVVNRLGLKPVVFWFESPREFNRDVIQTVLSLNIDSFVYVVVDECDGDAAAELRKFARKNPVKLRILSIVPYRDRDPHDGEDPCVLRLPQMSSADLKTLLNGFALEDSVQLGIESICEGYPKLAWVLAMEMAKEKAVSAEQYELSKRLIKNAVFKDGTTGKGWVDVILDADDQLVLGGLSLFIEIGIERDNKGELESLCRVLEIDQAIANERIDKHLRKGLLSKKGDFVYVTPLVLAHFLAIETIGKFRHKIVDLVGETGSLTRGGLGRSAIESFSKRLESIGRADANVAKLLQELLRAIANSCETVLFSKPIATVALSIAQNYPEKFLRDMDAKLATLSKQQIEQGTEGRRELVWFLERAAFYSSLFPIASMILLKLAKAENESWGNNSTRILTGYFSAFLSGSAAALQVRMDLLRKLLLSRDKLEFELGLEGLGIFLSESHARSAGHENKFNLPSEVIPEISFNDLFIEIDNTMTVVLGIEDPQRRVRVRLVVIDALRYLARIRWPGLTATFLEQLESLRDDSVRHQLLASLTQILAWERNCISDVLHKYLMEAIERLSGGDERSRLRRWLFGSLIGDHEADAEAMGLSSLAANVIKDPSQITRHRDLIESKGAVRAQFLFYLVGKMDRSLSCWPLIDPKTGSLNHEIGLKYIAGRAVEESSWADAVLDGYLRDKVVDRGLLFQVSRSIETPASFRRLIEILEDGSLSLLGYLSTGGRFARASQSEMQELIEVVQKHRDQSNAPILFEPMGQYLKAKNSLDARYFPYLLEISLAPTNGPMSEYYRKEFLGFVRKNVTKDCDISEVVLRLLQLMSDSKTEYRYLNQLSDVFLDIAKIAPEASYKCFRGYFIANPATAPRAAVTMRRRVFEIFYEFMKSDAMLLPECAWDTLVYFIPSGTRSLSEISLLLMKRFGENSQVVAKIVSHVFGDEGVFVGPISKHMKEKLAAVEDWVRRNDLENSPLMKRLIADMTAVVSRTRESEAQEELLMRSSD